MRRLRCARWRERGSGRSRAHTITHDNFNAPDPVRSSLALAWTAPEVAPETLEFRGLVLRVIPMTQATDAFFELRAILQYAPDGIFRDRFDSVP